MKTHVNCVGWVTLTKVLSLDYIILINIFAIFEVFKNKGERIIKENTVIEM